MEIMYILKIKGGELRYKIHDDCVVSHGAYVDSSKRRKGVFKELITSLINLPVVKEKGLYMAVSNRNIIPYLEGLGFKRTPDSIKGWGNPSNAINLHYESKRDI